MDRLGIFVFYDPQGIVDSYVEVLLQSMGRVCTRITAICNGFLENESREKLKRYCETIYIRNNHGLDGGALKDYFLNLAGNGEWRKADELVWFNDTCYGPFFPMEEIFDRMNQDAGLDFWGITAHSKSDAYWEGDTDAAIGEHLQTYFVVIRNRLLHADDFLRFWEGLPETESFHGTVAAYELQMTQFFADLGYRYGVLCDTRPADSNPEFVLNPTAENCYGLIAQMGCPFLKRKSFLFPKMQNLLYTGGEQIQRSLRYIRDKTDYDQNLIFSNLIRLYEESAWKGNVCLDWIFPTEALRNCDVLPASLILAEADHEDTIEELKDYIQDLPENCTLIFLTRTEDMADCIRHRVPGCGILLFPECPHGLYGMLAALRKRGDLSAEYICLIQEQWGTPANGLHISESSRRYGEIQNLIAGKGFISNVLTLFQQQPLLGLLEPPETVHTTGKSMPLGNAFPVVRQLAMLFGNIVPDGAQAVPVAQGPSLWCRAAAIAAVLPRLDELEPYETGGMLEKAITYIIQSSGFCSGTVMEAGYAALEWENRKYMVAKERMGNDRTVTGPADVAGLFFAVAEENAGYTDSTELCLSYRQIRQLFLLTARRYLEKKLGKKETKNPEGFVYLGFRDIKKMLDKRKHSAERGETEKTADCSAGN